MKTFARPKSLTELVSETLREWIISGDLDLGSQLSEARIATELKVSRTPVREAINRLEMEGLLVVEPQRGSFVFSLEPPELAKLCDARLCLESAAMIAAIDTNAATLAKRLSACVDEMTEARAKLAVVERLLEDKPVRCADSEYRRAAGEKNDAAALEELRRLVAPLTGEEFMRACEERCLAGKCGWPLCGAPTRFSGVSGSGCPGDDDARAVRRTTPDGSAGSVRRGRGTYRIDAVRRKPPLHFTQTACV